MRAKVRKNVKIEELKNGGIEEFLHLKTKKLKTKNQKLKTFRIFAL
jgi:hypothetical protein